MTDASSPISGSIDPKAFPFLLVDLHRNGAAGSLKVEGPSYQKALYFRGGRVLFGSSNDPRDQLGAILIESGKITPEQLEDVNTKVGPGNPLAKVLAESGFVSQRELAESARAKVERILSDVIAYTEGSFEFEDGVLPKGAVDLKLSTEKLILSAVRRVSDRSFVLRYLESLEVVLGPTPDRDERLAEIASEAGELPEHLDGTRTLKEAASLAGVDEFEAGKLACALLFLGLVERRGIAQPSRLDETMTMSADDEESESELDLSQTARIAFRGQEPEPEATPEPESDDVSAVGFFVEDASPAQESAESFESELPQAEPEPDPEPVPEPEAISETMPDFSVPAAVAEPRPEVSFPTQTSEPEPEPEPEHKGRPSEEDLAALDALLKPRSPEGPLEPLEKSAQGQGRWEPRFGVTSPRPSPRRSRGLSPVFIGVGIVVVLAILGGGGWYFLLRQPAAGPALPQAAAPTTLAQSTTTTLPDAGSQPPGEAPGPAAAPEGSPPTTAAAAQPTPTAPAKPAATPAPAAKGSGRSALADARRSLKSGDFPTAARAFASSVRAQPANAFSIQILMACAPETVQKGVQNAQDDRFFILPVHYKGRDCYRLGWGVYESEARARDALGTVPDYFRTGGARPQVVRTSTLLP